jgi:hypothetical protein
MASTYSTNLKIELIGTGEQAGTWGTTTNTNLGTALEQAVVGKADVTMSSTTITLTLTNANTAQNARAIYLNLTGSPGGAAVLEVPAIQKPYIVKNGSDQQVTIKVSGQTGVAIPTGKTALVYNNGTDVVTAVDFIPEIATTTVDTTNIEVTNIKAKDGTASITLADSTGVASFTANPVMSGGTANGVAFLNGSNVLTAGSALSFNGTVLQNTQSSAADGIMMGLQNTTTGSFIQFSQPAVANLLFGCPNADAFVWKTFGSGTYPERMRIDSSGNVGIGTSSPAAKIEVVGGTGQVFVGRFRNGDATGANNSGVDILCTSSATAGNRVAEIVLDADGANSSGSDYLAIQKTGNSGDAQISQVSNAALIFKTNNTERMRITSDGKVAVGTTTPYGKLNVSGGTGDDLFAVSGYVGGETNYNMTIRNPSTSVISFRQRWFTASQNDVEVMNFGSGDVNVIGALSKGSGSFKINHPLKPETHHLIHSFIEGPQADLIYRGKVQLVAGRAEVNIDTVAGMTEGTFVALNREVQCFTSNESDWDAVRGSVSGNILTIECQNAESNATISWMVIGERQDQHMYDTNWTDENGKVIVEPLKPVKEEVEPTDDAEDAALEGV